MTQSLEIAITKEALEHGAPEECATYGLLSILAGGAYLSEGFDYFSDQHRNGPLTSGYYLAEWLAWHWWRHRWEPRRGDTRWQLAHCMATVGEGYVWPDITVFSDGHRIALVAKPSIEPDAKTFRYTRDLSVILPASVWEEAVDGFFNQTIDRLSSEGIKDTNFHKLLGDVKAERSDPGLGRFRRIEALLGRDPDVSVNESFAGQIVMESDALGSDAVDEIAAHIGWRAEQKPAWLSLPDLTDYAHQEGFPASLPNDSRILKSRDSAFFMQQPAWQLGADLAKQLRHEEKFNGEPIGDKTLAEMAGVSSKSLNERHGDSLPIGFALKDSSGDRVAFRAKRNSGRRFELARLFADTLISASDKLHPATRAYTYRQKAQRAFAAELLSPSDSIVADLDGQYEDEETREDVAEKYGVSPWVVERQLVNRGLLPREDLDDPDVGPGLWEVA